MHRMNRVFVASFLVLLSGTAAAVELDDFVSRCDELRTVSLSTPDRNPTGIAPIQAYENVTIPTSSLDSLMAGLDTDSKADFRIVQLMRIMLLDRTAYEALILPNIKNIPYWLRPNDQVRVYWSENHHIMWMSSAWLLQEQFEVDVMDDTLQERLEHFLTLKIEYGYYEFYSSLYLPYTLSGLLNLVDFCQDPTIQELATNAARRLMQDIMYVVNSEGVFFPSAGRNQVSNYLEPYDSNYNSIVWLLTGLGATPTTVYHVGAFLTTSTTLMQNAGLMQSIVYSNEYNAILNIGHDIAAPVNDALTDRADQVLSQWSFGGYFHPAFIDDTMWLLDEYNLDEHDEFDDYSAILAIPDVLLDLGTAMFDLDKVTSGSVLCDVDLAVFRNLQVAMTSAQAFYPGYLGFQIFPFMAAVGRVAIWMQSGVGDGPVDKWSESSSSATNSHLPYIQQTANVALIMYNPSSKLQWTLETLVGIDNFDVSLHWPAPDDANSNCRDKDNCLVRAERLDNWFLGQQWGGFIAVRSPCGATVCREEKQTWAVVVGNEGMYRSWNDFVSAIGSADFEEGESGSWWSQTTYHGMISVDGQYGEKITIEHEW